MAINFRAPMTKHLKDTVLLMMSLKINLPFKTSLKLPKKLKTRLLKRHQIWLTLVKLTPLGDQDWSKTSIFQELQKKMLLKKSMNNPLVIRKLINKIKQIDKKLCIILTISFNHIYRSLLNPNPLVNNSLI